MVSDLVVQKKTLKRLGAQANELAASKPSKFARKHLEKLGWKQGDGLGKNRHGMATHVKVDMKDDVRGIGAKEVEDAQFKNTWWKNGFDDALSKIQIPTAASSSSNDDSSSSSSSDSEDDDSDLDRDAKISLITRDMSTYTDEDRKLFLACGGRRCGKRAGRLQTGKMLREQLADEKFKKAYEKALGENGEKAADSFHHIARESAILTNDKSFKKSKKKDKKDKASKKKKTKADRKRKRQSTSDPASASSSSSSSSSSSNQPEERKKRKGKKEKKEKKSKKAKTK